MKNRGMRLLLAGAVTVLGLSGCNDDDYFINDEGIQSVNLTDLTLGYKVSGTGGLGWAESFEYVEFCDGDTVSVYEGHEPSDGIFELYNNNLGVYMDDVDEAIATDADGTPGRLEVGVTYHADESMSLNAWTITSIEEIECTPTPR